MDIANRRAEKIVGKLSDLVSQVEQLKIDHGVPGRSVRQWKKDVKARYSTFLLEKEKLARFLSNRKRKTKKWKENDLKPNKTNREKRSDGYVCDKKSTNDVCGRR